MEYAFPPPPVSALPVATVPSSQKEAETAATESPAEKDQVFFPVNRIYCVGRNYASHVVEMGGDADRDPPVFFSKPRDSVVYCDATTPSNSQTDAASTSCSIAIPYPLSTRNLHYEIELVVAIGKEGVEIETSQANDHIFGYSVGVDLTRRDLQAAAKQSGQPWDSAKGFDQSAPMGCVYPKQVLTTNKNPSSSSLDEDGSSLLLSKEIWLDVNGQRRQSSRLGEMTWSVPEIVSALSHQFRLVPGDLIMTGTPSGVGPLEVGDVVTGGVEGLGQIAFRIVERE